MRSFSFLSAAPLLFAVGCGSASATIDPIEMATSSQPTSKPETVTLSFSRMDCIPDPSSTGSFDLDLSKGILFKGSTLTNKSGITGKCFQGTDLFNFSAENIKCKINLESNDGLNRLSSRKILYARTSGTFFLPNIANTDSEAMLFMHGTMSLSDKLTLATATASEVSRNVSDAAMMASSPSKLSDTIVINDPTMLTNGSAFISFRIRANCARKSMAVSSFIFDSIIPEWNISKIQISDSPEFPQDLPITPM